MCRIRREQARFHQVRNAISRYEARWLAEHYLFRTILLNALPIPGFRGNPCGCFEEGTLVATPDGLRPIEEIAVGDLVLAYDPATGETSAQAVTALIRPEPKALWRLEVQDADGETEVFFVTDDHPWLIEGQGWVETAALAPGSRIETADDRGLTILDTAITDRVERTYNLTVAGPHTFLVGEDGAVVHNTCPTGELARRLEQLGGGIPRFVPTPKGAPQFIFPNGMILRFDLRSGQFLTRQGPHINLKNFPAVPILISTFQ